MSKKKEKNSKLQPTAGNAELGRYAHYLTKSHFQSPESTTASDGLAIPDTEDNILGPFFERGFTKKRAKISQPLAKGTTLVIKGTVRAADTGKPLAGSILDIWHADADGKYDDDPNSPSKEVNRAQVVADENGDFEFETIHPAPYQIGVDKTTGQPIYRTDHVHVNAYYPQYKPLTTQMYFSNGKHNDTDNWIKKSLIMNIQRVERNGSFYELGTFPIVLAPSPIEPKDAA